MARTATLGIGAFLLSVVFVLASLWWIPDSARAADPVPGPIDEVIGVPSQIKKATLIGGSPMSDMAARDMMWALRAQANSVGTGTLVPPKVPITPAKPVVGAGAGSVLTGAFMAGWLITDGTLAMYGHITGDEPLEGLCSNNEWVVGAVQSLYMFSAPSCSVSFTLPNGDQGVTLGPLSYGGWSASYLNKKVLPAGSSYDMYCYTQTGQLGAGFSIAWDTGSTAPKLSVSGGGTYNCATGQGQRPAFRPDHGGTGAGHSKSPVMWVVNSQNVKVAEMTQTQADPLRTPDCKLKFADGSTATATGTKFRESEGFSLEGMSKVCNDALVSKPGGGTTLLPTEIEVGSTPDGGTRSINTQQTVPEYTPDEMKGLTVGNGRGLVLEKIVGTGVRSCMTWEADCADWWADTAEGTTTGLYRCTYAGATIALAECGVYRFTFDTRTGTPTITDPVTGEQIDWSAKPNTGNSLNPGVGPGTGPSPADQCFETGWSDVANPVDWVMVPVKCALVWAFVPRPEVVDTETTKANNAWKNTWPVKGMEAGVAAIAALQGFDLSGCEGPHIYWEISWPVPIVWDAHPLSACGPPYDFLALVSRVVLSLLAIGYCIWGLTRRVGAVVTAPGLGPGA